MIDLEDIQAAAKEIKAEKALGMDWWSAKLFADKSPQGDNLCQQLSSILSSGEIPDYCRVGKICPLSKTTNPVVTIDDIRPITIQSQPRKIIE